MAGQARARAVAAAGSMTRDECGLWVWSQSTSRPHRTYMCLKFVTWETRVGGRETVGGRGEGK